MATNVELTSNACVVCHGSGHVGLGRAEMACGSVRCSIAIQALGQNRSKDSGLGQLPILELM